MKRPLFRRPSDQKRVVDHVLGFLLAGGGLYLMVRQGIVSWQPVVVIALGVGLYSRQLVVDLVKAWKGRNEEEHE